MQSVAEVRDRQAPGAGAPSADDQNRPIQLGQNLFETLLEHICGREDENAGIFGQDHVFELTRDTTGEMAIGFDGAELIRVRDMGIRDGFDRFLFVNHGGEYRIQSVAIYGAF